ncbi:hypothetical protein QJQ45_021258 [Haematococcus lacustris]|nr:hypothetical protein QJQ45_021258 [Haematococcus lacustris]
MFDNKQLSPPVTVNQGKVGAQMQAVGQGTVHATAMSISFADNVPHQTGRQLGGGSPAPTAVGPAPVVPPAGPTAGSMTQPGTARDLIRLAKEARDQLLGSSNAVPKALQILQAHNTWRD